MRKLKCIESGGGNVTSPAAWRQRQQSAAARAAPPHPPPPPAAAGSASRHAAVPVRRRALQQSSAPGSSAGDVIDLGAPKILHVPHRAAPGVPRAAPRRTYTPNPRLYPGPARPRTVTRPPRRRHHRAHARPVPNARLYRPVPPRPRAPPPPPARPAAPWSPTPPPHAPLLTASHAALALAITTNAPRAAPLPPPRRPTTSPPPAPPPPAAHPRGAPAELMSEFVSCIMLRRYEPALRHCRRVLRHEPDNATAQAFFPLLASKVAAAAAPHATAHEGAGSASACSSSLSLASSHTTSLASIGSGGPTDEVVSSRQTVLAALRAQYVHAARG